MKKGEDTGKGKLARAENYCIYGVLAGTIVFSTGIGLSILNPKGISAILAMIGSFIAFMSTISLVIVWLIQEWKGE